MRRPHCVRDASDRTWHESHWIMFMSLLLYTSMQIGQYCFCANLRPHGVHISYPLYQPPFGCVVPHELHTAQSGHLNPRLGHDLSGPCGGGRHSMCHPFSHSSHVASRILVPSSLQPSHVLHPRHFHSSHASGRRSNVGFSRHLMCTRSRHAPHCSIPNFGATPCRFPGGPPASSRPRFAPAWPLAPGFAASISSSAGSSASSAPRSSAE